MLMWNIWAETKWHYAAICVASTLQIQPTLYRYMKQMNEVTNKATCISNKYKIQIEPLEFEWDKFIPTLEKDFPDILNEVLSCTNNQQHQPFSNVNSIMPNENILQ